MVNYIRSCFCKHDFELLSHEVAELAQYYWLTKKNRWVYMCKKCGYVKVVEE